jgi:protein-tyrosine phosphatase
VRSEYGFGPACRDERWVFGAQRPGYRKAGLTRSDVDTYIAFLRERGVKRVVCLLDQNQLCHYDFLPNGLIEHYHDAFGEERVRHAPVADYHLCPRKRLIDEILPFLGASAQTQEKALVHCSGGSGRTGHVLAAWLAYSRGLEAQQAIRRVEAEGRNPREAVECGRATTQELFDLLAAARVAGSAKRQER